MRYKLYFMLMTAWFFAITVQAQINRGTLKGIISNAGGVLQEGIPVGLEGTKLGNITDENGVFYIKNIPEGTYKLVVSGIGFKTKSFTVKVADGQNEPVNLVIDASAETLSEVVVSGVGSKNSQTSYAGLKIPVPIRDIPYSLQVVDRELIQQQQANRLGEIARNSPGVYLWTTIGAIDEYLGARGFTISDNGIFRNGIRNNYSSMPDAAGIERVEFLKGSSAILFGQINPGATVNIITKKPKFENGGEISLRMGNYGFVKPSADVYGALAKNLAYRLNVSYENGNSFRDKVKGKRFYVNPSLQWNIGKKTTLLIEGDYTKDERTTDYGLVAFSKITTNADGSKTNTYTIADLPRSRFLGASFNNNITKQANVSYTLTHKLNSLFTLRNIVGYSQTKKDGFSTGYHNTPLLANGDLVRSVQQLDQLDKYLIGQLDLLASVKTGILKHQALIGFDADNRRQDNPNWTTLSSYDTLNVFSLNTENGRRVRDDRPTLPQTTVSRPVINRFGAYAQDLISVGEKLKILLGVRYSYIDNESRTFYRKGLVQSGKTVANDSTVRSSKYPDAWTPSLGLVFNPIKNVSLYASYTNSFSPNTALDKDGNVLDPSRINQYEAGVKTDWFENRLSFNATYYSIINDDVVQADPSLAGRSMLSGRQDNKGVELTLSAKPVAGLVVSAGYSYIDARYTKNANYIEGSRPNNTPKNTGNIWVGYRLNSGSLKGAFLGAGIFFTGERNGDDYRKTTVSGVTTTLAPFILEAYHEIDVSFGYQWKRYGLMGKVSNLTNTLNYNVYRNVSINPTAPRQFAVTASVKF